MLDVAKNGNLRVLDLQKDAWDELLKVFMDANLYQTWEYDAVRRDRRKVRRIGLEKDGVFVAACQVRIYRVPIINKGVAYARWGPMWQRRGTESDFEIYRQAVRCLRTELSLRNGLVLRIFPMAFKGKDDQIGKILSEEGYRVQDEGKTERTLILDLGPSLSELRANFDQKWRNCLNRAEKNGLEIVMGHDDALIYQFSKMYWAMLKRKGLDEPPSDIEHLAKVQKELSTEYKLKVILCYQDRRICAGGIFATIGETGVYMSGATSDTGLKTNGSYMVQWKFVKWLKENGFKHYDLNGINPATNPGTYRFKRGLAGKKGRDVEFLGKFQVADSRFSEFVVKAGEGLISKRKIAKVSRTIRRDIANKLRGYSWG